MIRRPTFICLIRITTILNPDVWRRGKLCVDLLIYVFYPKDDRTQAVGIKRLTAVEGPVLPLEHLASTEVSPDQNIPICNVVHYFTFTVSIAACLLNTGCALDLGICAIPIISTPV